MARTYAFAIGGAIILSLTVAPMLSTKLLRATDSEKEGIVMRVLGRIYAPLVRFGATRPLITVLALAIGLGAVGFGARKLGAETMPKLEEGNLWIRATLPTSISREKATGYANRMRSIVRGCPPAPTVCDDSNRKHKMVLAAISQVGRPDDGTDVTGFNNIEIFAPLLSFDEWPRGYTKENLTDELSKDMDETFPGVLFNFSQMIGDNVEEAVAGVKGENAIKVFGPDIAQNEATAQKIVESLEHVRGVDDLGFFHSLGQPNVKVTPDREAAARYGLNSGDVMAVIEAAVGGRTVTRVYEGEKTFDLTVRFDPTHRESIEAIRSLDIATPNGAHVPLSQLAKVEVTPGALTIYREDGQRYTPAKFSVRGRDLATTIDDAQATVGREVALPYGTYTEWSGELNELRAARARLAWVVPLTLGLITLLAYAATRSWRGTIVVFANVPLAWAGGIIALLGAHIHLSVSAAMGFVSLLGIAAQDAILVVSYFARIQATGVPVQEAAERAVENRLRAVLMTTAVAMLGLLPAAVSHGVGSETQKPLALVVIGGGLLLAIVARLMQPALLVLLFRRVKAPGSIPAPSSPEAEAAVPHL
jgi:cobalt-zinc-cadmium resistance protein CzcA